MSLSPAATMNVASGVAWRDEIVILYATETGNARSVAGDAEAAATQLGLTARLLDMGEVTAADLASIETALFVASTFGEGEPPIAAEVFFRSLLASDAPVLGDLRFSVLALGDRAYTEFCGFGRALDARLDALGARRIAALQECDFDYAVPAAEWISGTLSTCAADRPEAEIVSLDLYRTVLAGALKRERRLLLSVISTRNMHQGTSNDRTMHVELSIAGEASAAFPYEPGDAVAVMPRNALATVISVIEASVGSLDDTLVAVLLGSKDITTVSSAMVVDYARLTRSSSLASLVDDSQALAAYAGTRHVVDLFREYPADLSGEQLLSLLRPLAPRHYSIASSRREVGDRLDLLVTRSSWPASDGVRHGVASGYLTDLGAKETTVEAVYKPNDNFRLPQDAHRPVIMIASGTGVAPFRGFMQDRRATGAAGLNWLFFGHRRSDSDFFYQDEWSSFRRAGILTQINCAFSRDPDGRGYVQHALLEQQNGLRRWIEDGAAIYICGSLAMGTAVEPPSHPSSVQQDAKEVCR